MTLELIGAMLWPNVPPPTPSQTWLFYCLIPINTILCIFSSPLPLSPPWFILISNMTGNWYKLNHVLNGRNYQLYSHFASLRLKTIISILRHWRWRDAMLLEPHFLSTHILKRHWCSLLEQKTPFGIWAVVSFFIEAF